MVSIIYSGRTGNNIFQYVAAYIFAKKFNFKIASSITDNKFELPSLEGQSIDCKVIDIDDNNFLYFLESEKVELAHYRFVGYYQIKEFVLKYRNEIKSLFKLSYQNRSKNEVFVSCRIGDIEGSRLVLPIEYYEDALKKIKFKKGYISSDSPNHPAIEYLMNKFNLELYNASPLDTIDFAKNFKNLVLSEGTFSWWIGFLSSAKNIYYNQRLFRWHGDIFVFPEWKALKYDWDLECVDANNKLKCLEIVKCI